MNTPSLILLTDADVEDMTRIRRSALAKMRMNGDGPPFIKVGGKVRYPADALRGWVDQLVAERAARLGESAGAVPVSTN